MRNDVVIVSGLPRSGTSMMMRMLEAGGIPPFTDTLRAADPDNPRGYYEYEPVKRLGKDASWMGDAVGHAVKVISSLLIHLPSDHRYSVILVNRVVEEVLASQQAMLARRVAQGEIGVEAIAPGRLEEEQRTLRRSYPLHLRQTRQWLKEQPNIRALVVEHRETVNDPQSVAHAVNMFLGGNLDEKAMAGAVEQHLYRQRS
jgi:hypothetical protein